VVTREGLVCSVLDVGRGTLIRTARVPDGPGIWASSRAGIWTVRADEHEWAALRLDTDTLDVSEVASSVVRVSGVAETATGTVLLGAMNAASGQSAAAFLGAGGAGEPPMALTGLRHPARMAARVGARLVIGDWAGQQPEPVSLSVVDAATLRHERAIRVPGAPCAFARHHGVQHVCPAVFAHDVHGIGHVEHHVTQSPASRIDDGYRSIGALTDTAGLCSHDQTVLRIEIDVRDQRPQRDAPHDPELLRVHDDQRRARPRGSEHDSQRVTCIGPDGTASSSGTPAERPE
jgi:hypothetical protein